MGLASELERCYQRARQHLGDGAEPLDVVETGEAHRKYWQPQQVRVLLLAESHVYTKADECVPMHGPNRFGPAGVPENFIRLVYCLGYGEPDYVGSRLVDNPGTWQYWLIFSSCVNSPDTTQFRAVLKGDSPEFKDRLSAKIGLLKSLRAKGVWLIDASVLALYTSGGGKPASHVRERVLQTCWDEYIAHVVAGAMPKQIIVIGQGVARALSGRLNELTKGEHITINQPQGLRSIDTISHAHQTYHSVCQEHCGSNER
jgi:hypothetical protein